MLSQPEGVRKRKAAERGFSLRSFEIIASLVTAGSRPTPGGNERPDGEPNQNAGEKNACHQGWCRQVHETSPCLVMDKLIAYAIFPPTQGNCF
jgi:hypothetical protein